MSAIGIPYLQTPAIIVNQALVAIGATDKFIGDITDGTKVAEAARYEYGQKLRQLLRANHWPFARKYGPLTLLADATGCTPGVSTVVEQPWTYAYAWPIDAVQGRWMPWNPPSGQPVSATGVPLTTGQSAIVNYSQVPARFLTSSSELYPITGGNVPWDQMPDLQRTEGVGPRSRKIILTDVCEAQFVYTKLVTTIEEWDDLFRKAMVASMAVIVAPSAIDDVKVRTVERDKQIAIAANILADARAAASNEAGYPQTTDHLPPWQTARNGGWFGRDGGLGAYPSVGGTLGTFLPWEPYSLGSSVM